MATDMADDENAVKAEIPGPAELPQGSAAAPPVHPPAPSGHPSVWTASDARGPLETAAEAAARRGDGAGALNSSEAVASDEPLPSEDPLAKHEPAFDPVQHAALDDRPVPVEAPQKRRSVLPIAAGLLIGALVGAGSAAIVYYAMGSTTTTDPQVASLASRIDALEHRPDAQAAVAGLKTSVTDLDSKVSALQNRPARTPSTPPASAPPASAPPASAPPVDLSPLQQKIAALQASLDTLKAQSAETKGLEAKVAALDTEVSNTKKDTSSTQSALIGVAGEQKLLAGKVMVPALAVVADSLVQQIDQGQPYAAQVDALTALGADPVKIAILRQSADSGVPSAKTLAAKFETLAEPITATAHKAPPNAGFVDRLKSGMFSMVSVRSVDDTSGTDLPSRIARIRDDLTHDDIAGALATWDALPPDAKAKGEAWGALAKTSAEAMNAARGLQHDAIVALGAKKS